MISAKVMSALYSKMQAVDGATTATRKWARETVCDSRLRGLSWLQAYSPAMTDRSRQIGLSPALCRTACMIDLRHRLSFAASRSAKCTSS
jgi:hypothetical protein